MMLLGSLGIVTSGEWQDKIKIRQGKSARIHMHILVNKQQVANLCIPYYFQW